MNERGFVSALQLEQSGRFPVQFVIDCTGFRGSILQQALGENASAGGNPVTETDKTATLPQGLPEFPAPAVSSEQCFLFDELPIVAGSTVPGRC